jgi:hypothetical protein
VKPAKASRLKYFLQARQALANLRHDGVEGSAFIGLTRLLQRISSGVSASRLACWASITASVGVGRILVVRLTQGQPAFDHRLRSVAVEDQERRAGGLGDLRRAFALSRLR